jgi:hypothetical protein
MESKLRSGIDADYAGALHLGPIPANPMSQVPDPQQGKASCARRADLVGRAGRAGQIRPTAGLYKNQQTGSPLASAANALRLQMQT